MSEPNRNASWDPDGYARRWLQGESGVDVACAQCARSGDTERQLVLNVTADEYECVRCGLVRCNFKWPTEGKGLI